MGDFWKKGREEGGFPQILESFQQGFHRLLNRGAGQNIERIGVGRLDAGLNFIVGGGADHSGVVAREFRSREEGIFEMFLSGKP